MTARSALPPGPRLPAVVQTALLVRDPIGFFERCQRRYGPLFHVKVVGFPKYIYVTDPELARKVYSSDRTIGRAGDARRDFLAPMVGETSLLCTEDEQWLRHRKLLGPALHRKHVEGYADRIAEIAAREVERWPLGEQLELRPRMQTITLEVILQLVFGIADADRLERFRELLPKLTDIAGSPLLWVVSPTLLSRYEDSALVRGVPNPYRSFLRVRDKVDELIYDEIARRREQLDEERGDVLSLLLHARDEDGNGLSDVELRDELITLLEAGHETTATGLAWAFERLTRHPEVMDRLTAEIDGGGDEYLGAVVRETLRSRSVIIDTPRLLRGTLELDGYEIPAGWYVAPMPALVQRDPALHPEPDEFRPERFLGDDPPRDGWIPFGGGKRHCVGSHLALLEMQTVIAEVLRRVRLEPASPEPERQRVCHVTLVPSERARVVAHARARRPSTPVRSSVSSAL